MGLPRYYWDSEVRNQILTYFLQINYSISISHPLNRVEVEESFFIGHITQAKLLCGVDIELHHCLYPGMS